MIWTLDKAVSLAQLCGGWKRVASSRFWRFEKYSSVTYEFPGSTFDLFPELQLSEEVRTNQIVIDLERSIEPGGIAFYISLTAVAHYFDQERYPRTQPLYRSGSHGKSQLRDLFFEVRRAVRGPTTLDQLAQVGR